MRLGFLLCGGFLGVWGVMIAFALLIMNLCATESFGVPLLSPLAPFNGRLVARDVIWRKSWKKLSAWNAEVQDMPGSSERGE